LPHVVGARAVDLVVNRAEHATTLDGHQAQAELAAFHAL